MKHSAVIIGAGYSGLSCAALLARDGWDVTVLEKNDQIGGRARVWETKGYTFDMGPSWYLMPEVFEHFFSLFGKKTSDYYKLLPLDPYYKVFFSPDEHALLTPDAKKNRELFESFQSGGGAALDAYTKQAAYKYDVAMKEFLYRDYKKITEFFNRRLMTEGLKLNVFKKLDNYVRNYVDDRRARQILEYAMVFLGTDPKDAPALYSIMSHVDLELGVFFPEGGMAGVAQGIAELCGELGVTIELNKEVTSAELAEVNGKKKIESVTTADGKIYEADVIISGADYHHTETDLLPAEARSYSEKYWNKRVLAPSMFIAYLGIGRELKGFEHHNLYFKEILGTDPKDAPALYSIMSHVDLELGVFFPEGGMAGVAQGIAELCGELGVTIELNKEVTSAELAEVNGKKKIESVTTADGKIYEADVIISGADYHHTETDLLPAEARSYSEKYWNKRVLAPSMFIAYLGIGRELKGFEHHNLYFKENWNDHFDAIFSEPAWPRQPCFYLSCISKTDASTAPEGCENVFVLVPVASGLDDSDDQRTAYFEHVMDHIEQITGEDLRKDVQVKRIFTHRDFISDYHAYKGTALSLAHTLFQTAVFRPSHKSRKADNLYYTGQYTHPGVGVPMTLIASEIVAEELKNTYT